MAKPLTQRILDALMQCAEDVKDLRQSRGDMNALTTTAKNNLVSAINEIKASLAAAGVHIDDANTAAVDSTLSSAKIVQLINAAKDQLIGGAGAAYDTFIELQQMIVNDQTTAAALATAVNNRVRYDAEQVLTQTQKAQACANIGIGDPDTDFLAAYNARKTS